MTPSAKKNAAKAMPNGNGLVGNVHQSTGSNMDDRSDQALGERKDIAVDLL